MSEVEGSKPKRRRLAVACDRCRSRKIRCDTLQPRCGPCGNADASCATTAPSANSRLVSVGPEEPLQRTETGVSRPSKRLASKAPQASTSSAPVSQPRSSNTQESPTFPTTTSSRTGPSPNSQHGLILTSTRPPDLPSLFDEQDTVESGSLAGMINDPGVVDIQSDRRRFVGSSSSQVMIKWVDQERRRRGRRGQTFASHLTYANAYSDELLFEGLDPLWEPLPEEPLLTVYLNGYFDTIHRLFPFLDEFAIRSCASSIDMTQRESTANLPMLYLIISLGVDSTSGVRSMSEVGDHYFQMAWKALPSLLARSDITSARALVLMALACRARNKDGIVWRVVSQAIGVCQTLGLHLANENDVPEIDIRLFFTAYILDKLTSIAVGRPSTIRDLECSVLLRTLQTDLSTPEPLQHFNAVISLCQILAGIQSSLFLTGAHYLSVKEALVRIGESDRQLLNWISTLPTNLRPRTEFAGTGEVKDPCTAFLHLTVHQSLILLHRHSIFDDQVVLQHLSQPAVLPFQDRLSQGKGICLSSARTILSIVDTLERSHPSCRYWTLDTPLAAMFVLGIQIHESSQTWQARADLALLKSACSVIQSDLTTFGFNPVYMELFSRWCTALEEKVDRGVGGTLPPSPEPWSEGDTNANVEDPEDIWATIFGPGVSGIPESLEALFQQSGDGSFDLFAIRN